MTLRTLLRRILPMRTLADIQKRADRIHVERGMVPGTFWVHAKLPDGHTAYLLAGDPDDTDARIVDRV